MLLLQAVSAAVLLASGATAQLVTDCTTMKDYTQRGIKTTNLPVTTQTVEIVSTPTSTVIKTIRAPRTVTFVSIATTVGTSLVTAPTPTSVVTVTPTSFVVTVPSTTVFAPTITPPDSTITERTPSATVYATVTSYDQTPSPYLEAAITATQVIQRRHLEADNGDLQAQLAARAAAPFEAQQARGARLGAVAPQHALGRKVNCQATATQTVTRAAATPFVVTQSILARPTAVRTSTITFVATSTVTPPGSLDMQTAPPVTTTLTATDTITRTQTPTGAAATVTTTLDGPAATETTTVNRSVFCDPSRPTYTFSSGTPGPNYDEQRLADGLDRQDCCQAASAIPGAASWFYADTGNGKACLAGTYPVDQCVASSSTASSAFRLRRGSGPEIGLLGCTTGFTWID